MAHHVGGNDSTRTSASERLSRRFTSSSEQETIEATKLRSRVEQLERDIAERERRISSAKQDSSDELNRLRARVSQLERDISDRDRKIFAAKEESANAKAEASQKMKLVVQLQKQLVDMEQARKTASSSSSSLFGTLLGAASGEMNEMDRLKRDLEVEREELVNKIKQNEQIRIEFDEYRRSSEQEKRNFSTILDKEVRERNGVEKRLLKVHEAFEVLKTQHEIMVKDVSEKSSREYFLLEEVERLRAENVILSRLAEHQREIQRGEGELTTICRDLAQWIRLLSYSSDPSRRAAFALSDVLARISESDFIKGDLILLERCRHLVTLVSQSISFGPKLIDLSAKTTIKDMIQGIHDAFGTSAILPTVLLSGDSTKNQHQLASTLIQYSVVEMAIVFGRQLDAIKEHNIMTKPTVLQSDESLLNALEDLTSGTDNVLQVPLSPISEVPQQEKKEMMKAIPIESKVESPLATKFRFHAQALNNLRRLRELEDDLVQLRASNVSLQDKLESITAERDSALISGVHERSVATRAREELRETRTSYDLQLRSMTDRIVELERLVAQREDEIKSAKAEAVLLHQIRKSFTQKS